MLMPGFSTPRIPAHIRLWLAAAITLALTPLLVTNVQGLLAQSSPIALARLLISETLIGAMIGLLGRFFFFALETLVTGVAMAIGIANSFGSPIDETEPVPVLATLVMLTVTTLFFLTDQHWEVLRGLVASYQAMPVADGFGVQFGLIQVADTLSKAFSLALRISSPFIAYAMIANFAVGLANKLTPQIPVYFICSPFILAGGLFLLYFAFRQFLELFIAGFGGWLVSG